VTGPTQIACELSSSHTRLYTYPILHAVPTNRRVSINARNVVMLAHGSYSVSALLHTYSKFQQPRCLAAGRSGEMMCMFQVVTLTPGSLNGYLQRARRNEQVGTHYTWKHSSSLASIQNSHKGGNLHQ
jgi:hypothetical protein